MKHVRNDKLIIKKFYNYLIVGVIIVFALQFGSLLDSILIGNILGESALSASSLSLPAIYLLELPALALSIGGPIVVSTLLGRRDIDKAKKVFSFTLILGVGISFIFTFIGIFFSYDIATLLCGNYVDLIPLMTPYLKAYLLQAPLLALGLLIVGFLGADNSPKLGAAYYIIANVFHIGTLLLFTIFGKGRWQMLGAGLSMGIGFLMGLVVLIPYKFSKRRTLSFSFKLTGILVHFKDILKSSSAQGLNVLLLFVMTLTLNIATTNYLATDSNDLIIYAMLSNSVFIVDLLVSGVLQLLPTVVSALYGEKDYFSIKAVVKRILVIGESIALVLTLIVIIYPQLFFYIFGVSLNGIKEVDLLVIRIYAISFIFYSLNKFILTYYPSIEQTIVTYVNLLTRNLVLGAPLLFLLIMHNGIMGYAIGIIIAECFALVFSIIYLILFYKIGKIKNKPLLLLPKVDNEMMEISFTSSLEDVSNSLTELRDALLNEGNIDEKTIAIISLTIEEIVTNMNTFNNHMKCTPSLIDVSIKKSGGKIIVRIRDNNINFDPTYHKDDDDIAGLSIINKVATSVNYLRLLNLNNTIIEFDERGN